MATAPPPRPRTAGTARLLMGSIPAPGVRPGSRSSSRPLSASHIAHLADILRDGLDTLTMFNPHHVASRPLSATSDAASGPSPRGARTAKSHESESSSRHATATASSVRSVPNRPATATHRRPPRRADSPRALPPPAESAQLQPPPVSPHRRRPMTAGPRRDPSPPGTTHPSGESPQGDDIRAMTAVQRLERTYFVALKRSHQEAIASAWQPRAAVTTQPAVPAPEAPMSSSMATDATPSVVPHRGSRPTSAAVERPPVHAASDGTIPPPLRFVPGVGFQPSVPTGCANDPRPPETVPSKTVGTATVLPETVPLNRENFFTAFGYRGVDAFIRDEKKRRFARRRLMEAKRMAAMATYGRPTLPTAMEYLAELAASQAPR